MNADEAREIAAWRAIDALGSDGRERGEWRLLDEDAVEGRDMVGDFHSRGVIGGAVDGLELLDRPDHRHFPVSYSAGCYSCQHSFLITRTSWRL